MRRNGRVVTESPGVGRVGRVENHRRMGEREGGGGGAQGGESLALCEDLSTSPRLKC